MDNSRSKEQTLGSVMAMHRAAINKCALIVLDESARIELKEFIINMLGCTNCSLIQEDSKKLTIFTLDEFISNNINGEYKDKKVVIDDPINVLAKLLGVKKQNIIINE